MKKLLETRCILKEWNNFLIKESTALRVKQMINALENFNSKIILKDSGNVITIFYKVNKGYKIRLMGRIYCTDSKSADMEPYQPGIGKGETNSTWYISSTEDTTDGMGPLLYEVLIEYISVQGPVGEEDKSGVGRGKNAALKPDSYVVTDEARAVWEKFDARNDIIKIQLDVDSEIAKRSGTIKQLTRDNPMDDTQQISAIVDRGHENWSESSLSRAYKKDNTDLINDLVQRGLITIKAS